jgi:hypothetical protein
MNAGARWNACWSGNDDGRSGTPHASYQPRVWLADPPHCGCETIPERPDILPRPKHFSRFSVTTAEEGGTGAVVVTPFRFLFSSIWREPCCAGLKRNCES